MSNTGFICDKEKRLGFGVLMDCSHVAHSLRPIIPSLGSKYPSGGLGVGNETPDKWIVRR